MPFRTRTLFINRFTTHLYLLAVTLCIFEISIKINFFSSLVMTDSQEFLMDPGSNSPKNFFFLCVCGVCEVSRRPLTTPEASQTYLAFLFLKRPLCVADGPRCSEARSVCPPACPSAPGLQGCCSWRRLICRNAVWRCLNSGCSQRRPWRSPREGSGCVFT